MLKDRCMAKHAIDRCMAKHVEYRCMTKLAEDICKAKHANKLYQCFYNLIVSASTKFESSTIMKQTKQCLSWRLSWTLRKHRLDRCLSSLHHHETDIYKKTKPNWALKLNRTKPWPELGLQKWAEPYEPALIWTGLNHRLAWIRCWTMWLNQVELEIWTKNLVDSRNLNQELSWTKWHWIKNQVWIEPGLNQTDSKSNSGKLI